MSSKGLAESDLYAPVKAYLESLGYAVKGEVAHCDITALQGDDLIIVELKRSFTLELLYQATDRQRITGSVYVAVPFPKRGYRAPHMQDLQRLCRRLGLGLMFVAFSRNGTAQVEVALHPGEDQATKPDRKRRIATLQEHQNRSGSYNTGGVTRRKLLTAYKEQALLLAQLLQQHGPLQTQALRALGGPKNCSNILNRNVYGWFLRLPQAGQRCYQFSLTEQGAAALEEYREFLLDK